MAGILHLIRVVLGELSHDATGDFCIVIPEVLPAIFRTNLRLGTLVIVYLCLRALCKQHAKAKREA